jgi:hypothetical protein
MGQSLHQLNWLVLRKNQQECSMSEFEYFAMFFTMGYAAGIFTIKYLLA